MADTQQVSVVGSKEIQTWDSRAAALAVVDDATKNEAVTLATRVAGAVRSVEKVETEEEYHWMVLAGSVLAKIRKKLKGWHDTRTEAADKLHKQMVKDRKDELSPIEAAEAIASARNRVFKDEQERIRRENEVALARAALKAQEDEALKVAEELAAQMRDSGSTEEEVAEVVEDVIQEAVSRPAPAPIAAATYQKASGERKPTMLWSAKIINLKLLAKAVAEGASEEFLIGITRVDSWGKMSSPALNKRADTEKKTDIGVAGVMGVSKESKAGFSTR